MTVATLAQEKISTQKIKDNRLFLLNKSYKFQNQYKAPKNRKTKKYCSHSYTLRSQITVSPTYFFFQKSFQPTTLIRAPSPPIYLFIFFNCFGVKPKKNHVVAFKRF